MSVLPHSPTPHRLTPTQLAVLRLIAEGRNLGDYVPAYAPGARRGRGAFPVTIASQAARQLARQGLVATGPSESGYVLTPAGTAVLTGQSVHEVHEGFGGVERIKGGGRVEPFSMTRTEYAVLVAARDGKLQALIDRGDVDPIEVRYWQRTGILTRGGELTAKGRETLAYAEQRGLTFPL